MSVLREMCMDCARFAVAQGEGALPLSVIALQSPDVTALRAMPVSRAPPPNFQTSERAIA